MQFKNRCFLQTQRVAATQVKRKPFSTTTDSVYICWPSFYNSTKFPPKKWALDLRALRKHVSQNRTKIERCIVLYGLHPEKQRDTCTNRNPTDGQCLQSKKQVVETKTGKSCIQAIHFWTHFLFFFLTYNWPLGARLSSVTGWLHLLLW